MPLELWLAFVLASTILVTIPGPTVTLVVSHGLAGRRPDRGRNRAGVALGDLAAMTVSLLGAGAVLAASATLFTALKLAGAGYLVWLGLRLWRTGPAADAVDATARPAGRRAMFWHAFAVTALNPKSIVFFIAFGPQFVAAGQAPLVQFAILELTSCWRRSTPRSGRCSRASSGRACGRPACSGWSPDRATAC